MHKIVRDAYDAPTAAAKARLETLQVLEHQLAHARYLHVLANKRGDDIAAADERVGRAQRALDDYRTGFIHS
jgi:hypothetical protein